MKTFQSAIDDVREFHETFGLPVSDTPTLATPELRKLRVKLLREEVDELEEALEKGDLVEVCDTLADIKYVLDGAALTFGIDLVGCFIEVHKSNMTKVGGYKREDGKWVKPETYTPPDLRRFTKVVSS